MPKPNLGEESCLSSITDCDKTSGPTPRWKKCCLNALPSPHDRLPRTVLAAGCKGVLLTP